MIEFFDMSLLFYENAAICIYRYEKCLIISQAITEKL